jgi:hypothetical protein
MKKQKNITQYGYNVTIHSVCDESYQSPEEWGEWYASYTNRMDSFIKHDSKYPDVNSIHNIKKGKIAYVVWIEWSSGDSFGHGDRCYTETIGLFKDMESAKSLQNQIETWIPNEKSKKWEDHYSYHFKTPDGQEFKSGFAPWSGYFDSLDSVNIDVVTVI